VDWYSEHVVAWSRRALPSTTLWFWGTEIGWATVHPLLRRHGWEYRSCHVWDKGMAHAAGNANTQTLRKLPVVTEVCVQYVREVLLDSMGAKLPLKAWLRREWERSGLPLSRTNEACGVKNAATRKYFTRCHLWYFPPAAAFARIAAFANAHGRPEGRPYFSVDGRRSLSGEEWSGLRAKFRCEVGVTNVWREPAVRGAERFKADARALHGNQKPLRLLDLIIRASSDPGDVVWEPFGGLCSVAVAAHAAGRRGYSAEISPRYHALATARLARCRAIEVAESSAA
jgi:site-specific DNA-methyltransferase (adenine-specific)